jgi:O-acetyl-ADP-ribose deacetylase (regulator of RNase III)
VNEIAVERIGLEEAKAEVLAYGAKDTGEMGGGAAASILRVAGPDLIPALRQELARSTRQIGDAVLTDAFGLRDRGVRWIAHVLSIIKNTSEGAWCPKPEKLYDGVMKALELSSEKRVKSIAFSMLGTGEGRVKPADAARIMIRAIQDFQRGGGELSVMFALPTFRDYDAVQRLLASS